MERGKRRLLNVWEGRKHLIVLLLTLGVFCVLAVVTSHVSAGPAPAVPLEVTEPPVGGVTLPYGWLGALAPLVALVALGLAAAGVAVVWSHRRR